MGVLEEISQKKTRKSKIQAAILISIASGGRIGGDLLIKQVADYMLGTDFSITPPRRSEVVRSAANRLSKKGLLVFKDGCYSITKSGEKILNDWHGSRYAIKIPRKWDKKWRVVIFDIPEHKKNTRDQVREILMAARFKKLQNSVWVYPYDCEGVIGLMKTDLGIGKYLLYMIVDQIENDRYLRMDFGLLT